MAGLEALESVSQHLDAGPGRDSVEQGSGGEFDGGFEPKGVAESGLVGFEPQQGEDAAVGEFGGDLKGCPGGYGDRLQPGQHLPAR